MIPRISDAAVSGVSYSISPDAREALRKGDVSSLLAVHRTRFAGWSMVKDDDSKDDDNDDGSDDGDDDGGDDDDDDDADKDEKSKSADQKRIDELNAENKRRRTKAREQDQKIRELTASVEKLTKKPKGKADDDTDGDDSEKDEEITTLKSKIDDSERKNEDLLIRLEFTNLVTGSDAKHQFKNPSKALRLLDLDDVEITDKGTIEGLEDAIADLAKSDPYLLADAGKDDDDDEDDTKRRQRKTGQQTGNRRGNRGSPNRDKLVQKYPALRR